MARVAHSTGVCRASSAKSLANRRVGREYGVRDRTSAALW
jgi:hypothetical protein